MEPLRGPGSIVRVLRTRPWVWGKNRREAVFPKVDALRARVDGAAGPLALGAKGSVRDRLTPPGRVEGSALGSYIVSLRWRGTAPFYRKPLQPPCGRRKCIPPLVAGATTFPPQAGALWMLSHVAMSLQESIERFILPPLAGEVRRSRIGGGERSEPISRMPIMPYDIESQSRNADFILIARKGDTTTL